MDMCFPFDLADSNIVDGRIDHRSLLASAISRQANGTTARLMLRNCVGAATKQNAATVNPLHTRISYFARKTDLQPATHGASGCFFVIPDANNDQQMGKSESVVYQDISAIRKQQHIKECISEVILISEGQENLRQI